MTGSELKYLIERVRKERPTHICRLCGTLRTDVDERCDLHPDEEPVSIHSSAWTAARRRLPDQREKRELLGWRAASVVALAACCALIVQAVVLPDSGSLALLLIAAMIPIASLIALRAWVVPWGRKNKALMRNARQNLALAAWLTLILTIVSSVMVWADALRGEVNVIQVWWLYLFAVPLFLVAASFAWRHADLEQWGPPERVGPPAPEAEDPPSGRIKGEAGDVVGYYLVGRPTRARTLIDGWLKEVEIELDDKRTVRMQQGPLRMLGSEGATTLSDAQVHPTLVWYWNTSGPPDFFLTGAELNVLRGGDRVSLHAEITRDVKAGETYRETGDAVYRATGPHYLEQS